MEMVYKDSQQSLQLRERVRKSNHRKRVSICAHALTQALFHGQTAERNSNVTWFWLFAERLYLAFFA